MLDKLFTFATWYVALASLLVLVVAMVLLTLSNPKQAIEKGLNRDYVATDSPFQTEGFHWYGYDTARVVNMLTKYNGDPDHFYGLHERFILRHDLVFPVCYGLAFLFMLAYLQGQVGGVPRWVALVLPLAAVTFDYAENFTMLAFLRAFRRNPQAPLTLLEFSRAFTVAKWAAVMLTLIALGVLLVACIVSRFRTGPAGS